MTETHNLKPSPEQKIDHSPAFILYFTSQSLYKVLKKMKKADTSTSTSEQAIDSIISSLSENLMALYSCVDYSPDPLTETKNKFENSSFFLKRILQQNPQFDTKIMPYTLLPFHLCASALWKKVKGNVSDKAFTEHIAIATDFFKRITDFLDDHHEAYQHHPIIPQLYSAYLGSAEIIIATVMSQVVIKGSLTAAEKIALVTTLLGQLNQLNPLFQRAIKVTPLELSSLEELATILGRWSVAYDTLQFPLATIHPSKAAKSKAEIQKCNAAIDTYVKTLLDRVGSLDISDNQPYLLWCQRRVTPLESTQSLLPATNTTLTTSSRNKKGNSENFAQTIQNLAQQINAVFQDALKNLAAFKKFGSDLKEYIKILEGITNTYPKKRDIVDLYSIWTEYCFAEIHRARSLEIAKQSRETLLNEELQAIANSHYKKVVNFLIKDSSSHQQHVLFPLLCRAYSGWLETIPSHSYHQIENAASWAETLQLSWKYLNTLDEIKTNLLGTIQSARTNLATFMNLANALKCLFEKYDNVNQKLMSFAVKNSQLLQVTKNLIAHVARSQLSLIDSAEYIGSQTMMLPFGESEFNENRENLDWCTQAITQKERLEETLAQNAKSIVMTTTKTTADTPKSNAKRKRGKRKTPHAVESESIPVKDKAVPENTTVVSCPELPLNNEIETKAKPNKTIEPTPSVPTGKTAGNVNTNARSKFKTKPKPISKCEETPAPKKANPAPTLIFPYPVDAIRKEHQQRQIILGQDVPKGSKLKHRTPTSLVLTTQSNSQRGERLFSAKIPANTSPSISLDIPPNATETSSVALAPIITKQQQTSATTPTLSTVTVMLTPCVIIPTVAPFSTPKQIILQSAKVMTEQVIYHLFEVSNMIRNSPLLEDASFLGAARSRLSYAYKQFCTILDREIFIEFEMDAIHDTITNLALVLRFDLTPDLSLVRKHSIDKGSINHEDEPRQPKYLYPYLATQADSLLNASMAEPHPVERKRCLSMASFYYSQLIQLANLYRTIRVQDPQFQIWLGEVNERYRSCQEMLSSMEETSVMSLSRRELG